MFVAGVTLNGDVDAESPLMPLQPPPPATVAFPPTPDDSPDERVVTNEHVDDAMAGAAGADMTSADAADVVMVVTPSESAPPLQAQALFQNPDAHMMTSPSEQSSADVMPDSVAPGIFVTCTKHTHPVVIQINSMRIAHIIIQGFSCLAFKVVTCPDIDCVLVLLLISI